MTAPIIDETDPVVLALRAEATRVLTLLLTHQDATFAVGGVPIVTLRPLQADDGHVRQSTEEYLGALAAAAFCGALLERRGH